MDCELVPACDFQEGSPRITEKALNSLAEAIHVHGFSSSRYFGIIRRPVDGDWVNLSHDHGGGVLLSFEQHVEDGVLAKSQELVMRIDGSSRTSSVNNRTQGIKVRAYPIIPRG